MIVCIKLTVIGLNNGPLFDLYHDADGYTTAFDTDVTPARLLAGECWDIDDDAQYVLIHNTGLLCEDLILPIIPCTTTTTTTEGITLRWIYYVINDADDAGKKVQDIGWVRGSWGDDAPSAWVYHIGGGMQFFLELDASGVSYYYDDYLNCLHPSECFDTNPGVKCFWAYDIIVDGGLYDYPFNQIGQGHTVWTWITDTLYHEDDIATVMSNATEVPLWAHSGNFTYANFSVIGLDETNPYIYVVVDYRKNTTTTTSSSSTTTTSTTTEEEVTTTTTTTAEEVTTTTTTVEEEITTTTTTTEFPT